MRLEDGSLLYLGPELRRSAQLQGLFVVSGVHVLGNLFSHSCIGEWVRHILQGAARRRPTTFCQVSPHSMYVPDDHISIIMMPLPMYTCTYLLLCNAILMAIIGP